MKSGRERKEGRFARDGLDGKWERALKEGGEMEGKRYKEDEREA